MLAWKCQAPQHSFAVSAGTRRQTCPLCISLIFSRRTLQRVSATAVRVGIPPAASHLIRREMNSVSVPWQYNEPTARIQR